MYLSPNWAEEGGGWSEIMGVFLPPPLPEVLEHLADHLLLGADQQPHHVVPR